MEAAPLAPSRKRAAIVVGGVASVEPGEVALGAVEDHEADAASAAGFIDGKG